VGKCNLAKGVEGKTSLISPCLHQDNIYQLITIPQTVPVPSSSLSLPQGDLFSALGYTPQPLAQEDLFIALGYTPVDTTQIQESTCVQGAAQELQSVPHDT
jgi:hypothetical protein